MYKAVFHDKVIARSDRTIEIEGNQYFPQEDVDFDYLTESTHHTTCPWKGLASYYHVVSGSDRTENAAWVYEDPKTKAVQIRGYIAFWKDISVIKE
ncbi:MULTISPECIES: DUF427 domain-containing protein [unclassified Fusibacter]|uniref:DUF427 domain-containing protein n=1 Tax=unclassified Fusibacter TaxID=2624464 RepID=UPI001010A357|nr:MULTISPECIES: DUF427 domain-containing protein [unclassified Fusibacter]MCK8059973.1 DUF427 domain-containing protein [Fusibacter sp. A2]NPE22113.1 DUF427 domain-containing protein [Fusibacter sp. A1]RXV60891.1 DUF427 domain-containing protein [Fusibacter sp. A1]